MSTRPDPTGPVPAGPDPRTPTDAREDAPEDTTPAGRPVGHEGIRVDIDDTTTGCPAQCDTCKAAERPVWAKRPGYGPHPAILHLVADVTDKHAACRAYGIDPKSADRHTAMYDAELVEELFDLATVGAYRVNR